MERRFDRMVVLVFFGLGLTYQVVLHREGMGLIDEGHLRNAAHGVTAGESFHRDVYAAHLTASFFAVAWLLDLGRMARGSVLVWLWVALSATGVGLALVEVALRVADLPLSGPFLQEFRGTGFELMAYDSNPTGAFDLELGDDDLRQRLGARLANPGELEDHWEDTPWAVSFELNSQGFRERKLVPKSAGTKRVVIVGGSFTVGHGLPNTLAYPRLLESRLQRALEHGPELESGDPRSTSVEVLNLGRGNTDLPAIARSAELALRQLAPDVLVYGYSMSDSVPGIERDTASPIPDMLDAGSVAVAPSPSMTRIGRSEPGRSRVFDLVKRFLADRSLTHTTIDGYLRLHEPAAWRPTLARITAMSQAARAQDARFILLLLPLPFEIADSPFAEAHRQMREAAARAAIEVVDALPALARHPDEALRLHPRDRHPSPLYARVVAELLAPVVLEALGPISPPGSAARVPAAPGPGRARSGK